MPADPTPDWILARRRAVGDRIRSVRQHAGLTQEKLAEHAGLDRQAINKIEQGHDSAKLDSLIRIADALDVDLSVIVRLE